MAHAMRIPFDQVVATLRGVLVSRGVAFDHAELCANIFASASRDGIPSHGVDRFVGFVQSIEHGTVDVKARPKLLLQAGGIERWDGNLGIGPVNAWHAMGRAIVLCREHGIGCVGLCRTNHWMRAGNYGWQAADAGVIGMCWTNTNAQMAPWGSAEKKIGNNPLVVAIPRKGGHVVLDMALSQFSNGKLNSLIRSGQRTPVVGGFDAQGNTSTDPSAIMKGGRPLPIGCWKGAGLALMLDIIAAAISGGFATCQITGDVTRNAAGGQGVSQAFIAINPESLGGLDAVSSVADAVIQDIHAAAPLSGEQVLYPGERVRNTRAENVSAGIPIAEAIWEPILKMSGAVPA